MNRDERNFHAMLRSVLTTRTDHPVVTSAPPALVRGFDAIVAFEARLNAARRRQGEPLTGIASQKNSLKSEMIIAILPIAGMLQAHASEQNNLERRTAVDFSYTDLLRLPDLDCLNTTADLLEKASETPLRETLIADFGLVEAQLEASDALMTEYAQLIGSPRNGIVRRRGAGEEIEDVIIAARDTLINRLDPLVRQFDRRDDEAKRTFFRNYEAAREIVDTPGARNEPSETNTTPDA